MAKQETVTVELDKDLLDRLENLSEETGMSISELAGKILRHHTETLDKSQNESITIDGKRVLCDEFISALDKYRFDVQMDYNETIYKQYCRMISQIQTMTDTYHNSPEKWPTESLIKRLRELGFSEIEKKQLPEAINEALRQMISALGVNLDKMLSDCEEKSKVAAEKKEHDT